MVKGDTRFCEIITDARGLARLTTYLASEANTMAHTKDGLDTKAAKQSAIFDRDAVYRIEEVRPADDQYVEMRGDFPPGSIYLVAIAPFRELEYYKGKVASAHLQNLFEMINEIRVT